MTAAVSPACSVKSGRSRITDSRTTIGNSSSGGADSAGTGPRGERNDAITITAAATARANTAPTHPPRTRRGNPAPPPPHPPGQQRPEPVGATQPREQHQLAGDRESEHARV